jgi:hypothetical protein
MANPWFRMYHEFATDPKVQMMPEVMQRRLLMLFCAQCSEMLDTFDDTELAFYLRISDSDLEATKKVFLAKGFIDENWSLVNWAKRQPESAKSTGRVKRFRDKRKQVETVRETCETVSCVSHDVSCSLGNAGEQNRTEQNRTEQNRAGEPAKQNSPISSEKITRSVLVELGISGRDLSVVLDEVCRSQMRHYATPGDLRDAMVDSWRQYDASKPNLEYAKGPAKFFGDGDWRNKAGWPWKQGSPPQSAAPKPKYMTPPRRPDAEVIQ